MKQSHPNVIVTEGLEGGRWNEDEKEGMGKVPLHLLLLLLLLLQGAGPMSKGQGQKKGSLFLLVSLVAHCASSCAFCYVAMSAVIRPVDAMVTRYYFNFNNCSL